MCWEACQDPSQGPRAAEKPCFSARSWPGIQERQKEKSSQEDQSQEQCHVEGQERPPVRSQAFSRYDKMKQAHSMIADQPGKRREIKVVYRKAMDLQNEIDKIKQSGNGEEGIHCFAPYHGRTPFVV